MTTIALIGAGGKMGQRITDNLKRSDFHVRYVEVSERGRAALAQKNVSTVALETAVEAADVVILAVPDNAIGKVASGILPHLRAGALVVVLDAAAPYAGELPERDEIAYFVTHPCHPPLFNKEETEAGRQDFFGGIAARQNIVCALFRGPESMYALGEQVARVIYAPVIHAYRCTVEQIAILEPVLSETVAATCLTIIREAMDEAIRLGVPAEAAQAFLSGHLNIELGIIFDAFPGGRFSDGALTAIEEAKRKLMRPDWKDVFKPEQIRESVRSITGTLTKPEVR